MGEIIFILLAGFTLFGLGYIIGVEGQRKAVEPPEYMQVTDPKCHHHKDAVRCVLERLLAENAFEIECCTDCYHKLLAHPLKSHDGFAPKGFMMRREGKTIIVAIDDYQLKLFLTRKKFAECLKEKQ